MRFDFDPLKQKYPSRRYPIYAMGGMINSSSPQASSAGLEILAKGGNAMDAAAATAAALTVTEPTSNGIGSDTFALIWSEKDKKLYGLNSSGRSPMLATAERLRQDGAVVDDKMPCFGWAPVNVPGAPKAWAAINERFGRLSLAEDMAPAVRLAAEGYPCSPNHSSRWKIAYDRFSSVLKGECFEEWFRVFAPQGRAPEAGEIVCLPDHAATLEEIGRTNAESFYTGRIARLIDAESKKYGGYLRYEDLAAHEALWVEPISVNYRGYDVFELPPNGQGIVVLMALNIMKEFSFSEELTEETCHRQIEAIKASFADAFRTVTDPEYMTFDYNRYLMPEYGAAKAAEITDRAQVWTDDAPSKSGTVYFCCADSEGNMVSFIQSNYLGFGSGVVVKGTGIALADRGVDFSLDPGHVNYLQPGKRSYHTIIPGFLMKEGRPVGPFGVMGGYMQPQGHIQLLSNFIDFNMDPQQALDAPRWQWMRDGSVIVEESFDEKIIRSLRERGHDIRVTDDVAEFGRGQMIVRLDNGVLVGGTESRTDSNIACI